MKSFSQKSKVFQVLRCLVFVLVSMGPCMEAIAQDVVKEWSTTWRSSKNARPSRSPQRKVTLQWDPRQAGRKRSHDLLSAIALHVDKQTAADTVWQDVRVKLEVTAKCNPDHNDYRRSADYDSVFVMELRVGDRPDGKGRLGLDSLLDKQATDRLRIPYAHALECIVQEILISDGRAWRPTDELPQSVFLELSTRWQLRSLLDVESSLLEFEVPETLMCGDGEDGGQAYELNVRWLEPMAGGVEEYQLEWAFIDDYSSIPSGDALGADGLHFDLRFDATRVSVKKGDHAYRIPLHYDRGYLVYRVRAVGIQDIVDDPYPGGPVFGLWNGPDAGKVSEIEHYHISVPHEPWKNWQVTSSYAEDGLHKEVMTYADGSLRPRQQVMRNSSLDVPIIGETFYDQTGRAVVQALPVPMIKGQGCEEVDHAWAPIKYYPDFNLNAANEPYSSDDLQAGDGCGLSAAPMSDANGAALYYSSAQVGLEGGLIKEYPFLPRANGYPFAQTEYTRDNTGRIVGKGGVGEALQLGAHATTMSYSTPDQTEIDRLFGAEAGYASHYQRTTTVDPNGQASVTYTDRAGRTVATALFGAAGIESAGSLEELPSRTALTAAVHTEYSLGGNGQSSSSDPSNHYDPDLPGWTLTTTFEVMEPAVYTFDYSLAPPADGYVPACPNGLCYNCIYRLAFTLMDECGQPVPGFERAETFGTLDRLAHGVTIARAEPTDLEPGVYTIQKVLTLDQGALNTHLEDYMTHIATCDEFDEEDIWHEIVTNSLSGCNITCEDLKAIVDLGLDGFLHGGLGSEADFQAIKDEYLERCVPPSWCESAYDNMLLDMSPNGGQYARYERNGTVVTTPDITSVLNTNSILKRKFDPIGSGTPSAEQVLLNKALWQQPMLLLDDGTWVREYQENDGTRTHIPVYPDGAGGYDPPLIAGAPVLEEEPIEGQPVSYFSYPEYLLELRDFITAFRMDGWARSLLRFHPEYGYYVDCRRYSEEPTVGPEHITSDEFDRRMSECTTFAEALTNGWFKVLDDPEGKVVFAGDDPERAGSDPYVTYAEDFGDEAEAFKALVGNYQQTGPIAYSMTEIAAIMIRCGGTLGASISPVCLEFGEGDATLDAAELNREWETFKGIYLSEKYRSQKRHADRLGYTYMDCSSISGVNLCIGEEENDRDWQRGMPRGTGDTPYMGYLRGALWQGCQPCNAWSFRYYTHKVRRFAEPPAPTQANSPRNRAYQVYQATGLCPTAAAWLTLFDQMAIADRLITTDDAAPVNTSGFPLSDFPPYQNVVLAQTDYTPITSIDEDLVWKGVASGGGGIDITVGTGSGGDCSITLDTLPSGVEWDDIVGIPNMQVQANSPNFYLNVQYVDGGGILRMATVPGVMCEDYLLTPCNFPPLCAPTPLGYGIQNTMAMIASLGHLFDAPGTPFAMGSATVNGQPLAFYAPSEVRQLFGPPYSVDQQWVYEDLSPSGIGQFVMQRIGGGALVLEVMEVIEGPTAFDINDPDDQADVRDVTDLSGDHENFFTAMLRDEDGTALGLIRCAAWWRPASGPREPLKPGKCALPPSFGCEDTEEDLFDDLFAWVRERMLSTPPLANIDLFDSPVLTEELRSIFAPILCNTDPPIEGVFTCGTTSMASHDLPNPSVPETTTTYTFNDDACFSIKVTTADPTFDDIRDPHPLAPADEGGSYHGLVADLYHLGQRTGMLRVEFPCVGYRLCKTCGPALCAEEDSAASWTAALLDILGERYLSQFHTDSEADDLFESPLMTAGRADDLGPLVCPECPPGEWEAARTIGEGLSFDFGCLSLEGSTPYEGGWLTEFKFYPIAYLNGWEPMDAADANGQHHRFKAYLWHDSERLRSYVTADLGCIRFPSCPTACEQGSAALQVARWLAETMRNEGPEARPDLFDAPAMTQELADELRPSVCAGPEDCPDGPYTAYTAVPVYDTWSYGYYSLRYGPSGCFRLNFPKQFYDSSVDATLDEWVSVDAPDENGLHHVFRANFGQDSLSGLRIAVTLRMDCIGVPACAGIRDRSSACDDPANTVMNDLVAVLSERLQPVWPTASGSFDLTLSPAMTSALADELGSSATTSSTAGPFTSRYIITFGSGGLIVEMPDVAFTSMEFVGTGEADYYADVLSGTVRVGYARITQSIGLPYCALGDPYSDYDPDAAVIPQTSCGTTPAFPCTAEVSACESKRDELYALVNTFNAFADASTTRDIDAEWIDENPCYFVNEFLCPCLDGYMAKIRAAMLDNTLSVAEQEDPTLWCILDYCTMPELACSPIPAVLGPVVAGPPGEQEDPCSGGIDVNASMSAQLLVEQRVQRYAHDFRTAYTDKCKSGLETLWRTHTGKPEHHFTLYYYDQAGNLVRTVPPAGVALADVSDPHIASDRASGSRTFFTAHAMASDHGYNSLGQPTYERAPDKDLMALWSGRLPSGLPTGLRVTGSSFLEGGRGYLSGWSNATLPGGATATRGYVFRTDDGGSSWMKAPGLIGSDLRGIEFVSSTLGYAVGSNGVMMKTLDGGQSWDQAALDITHLDGLHFNDVAFFDTQNGIVVGDNGFIKRTPNAMNGWYTAGGTYTKVSGVHDVLAAVAGTSYSYIAALEEVGGTNGKNGVFVLGQSASTASSHYLPQGNTMAMAANFNASCVLDQDHVFIAGTCGTLLRSENASSTSTTAGVPTWRVVPTHGTDDFIDIWFFDTDPGVGLAIMDEVTGATHRGVLRYTLDAGETWIACEGQEGTDLRDLREYARTATNAEVLAVGAQGKVLRVFITDGSAPSIMDVPGPSNSFELTSAWVGAQDGRTIALIGDIEGKLWWTLDLLTEHPTWANEGVFSGGHRVRGIEAKVLSSTKVNITLLSGASAFGAGKRWVGQLNNSPTPDLTAVSAGTDNYYEAIGMRSNGRAVLFNTNTNRIETTDLSSDPPPASTLVGGAASPITSVRTLAVLSDARTMGAGAFSLSAAPDPQPRGGIVLANESSPPSPTTTWYDRTKAIFPLPVYAFNKTRDTPDAAGAQGTLYHRYTGTNGYWLAVPTRHGGDLHGVTVASDGTAYAVGDDGLMLTGNLYGDNGDAFTKVDLPVSYDLNDIRRVGNEVTVAADDGNILYNSDITAPGGSFAESHFNCGNINRLVHIPSTNGIIAIGDGGVVQRLQGISRIPVEQVFTGQLNDVAFADPLNGYAVGVSGLVRRTTDGGNSWRPVPYNTPATSAAFGAPVVSTFKAVSCDRPGHAIAVGASNLCRVMNGPSHAGITVTGSASTWNWNDVAISRDGNIGLAGALSTPSGTGGKLAYWKNGGTTWTVKNSNSTANGDPLCIWSFPRTATNKEDFIAGTGKGFLLRFGYDHTSNTLSSATLVNATAITGTPKILSLWFHDDINGLIGTGGGGLFRIALHPENLGGSPVTYWHTTAPLPTEMPATVFPDAIDGQTDKSKIDINTIGFTDRSQGFLGGVYDVNSTLSPAKYKRYARTIRDEMDLCTSRFWYDRVGRLVLSQSSEQFSSSDVGVPTRYSYMFYDALGRVVESGQLADRNLAVGVDLHHETIQDALGVGADGPLRSANIIDAAALRAWIEDQTPGNIHVALSDRTEVVRTTYDEQADATVRSAFTDGRQDNLHQRVATMAYYNTLNDTIYQHASHFSYDIHGNVRSVVQDYPPLAAEVDGTQRFKRIDYAYDLISGNVRAVHYQSGAADQFHHRYTYDADSRITKVETSSDGIDYHEDAAYFYYPHGPLQRTELGTLKVQGLDYAYTLQGWIKGVNSELLHPANDMGQDGVVFPTDPLHPDPNPHENVGRDAFGYSLSYFNGDYEPISADRWDNSEQERPFAPHDWTGSGHDLFNGNIAATVHSLQPWNGWTGHASDPGDALAGVYRYDQLNRLRSYTTLTGLTPGANDWRDAATTAGRYSSVYTYDPNGNIETAQRFDGDPLDPTNTRYDNFSYQYPADAVTHRRTRNRLTGLTDTGNSGRVTLADDQVQDLDGTRTYTYDHNGNLRSDENEEIGRISWTAAGKVSRVQRIGDGNALRFGYGADGHRVVKSVYNTAGNTLLHRDWYVYDPQGNVMATYRSEPGEGAFHVTERMIYGSTRLGNYGLALELPAEEEPPTLEQADLKYELTDHLGNVATVITGSLLLGTGAAHEAEVISAQGYEPFGSLLPGRNHSADYRFAFQGQEKVDEVFGATGTSYTAEFWQYDPRTGRRWNLDPRPQISISDYAAFGLNPIVNVDPNGAYFFGLFGSTSEQRQAADKHAAENNGIVVNRHSKNIGDSFLAQKGVGSDGVGFGVQELQQFNADGSLIPLEGTISATGISGYELMKNSYFSHPTNRLVYGILDEAYLGFQGSPFNLTRSPGERRHLTGESASQAEVEMGYISTSSFALGPLAKGIAPTAEAATVLGTDAITLRNAARLVAEDGLQQVLVHGTPDGFIVNGASMTPKEMAYTLLNTGTQRGSVIRLVSCNTGMYGDGAAYQLSRYMNSTVIAPSNRVAVTESGRYFIDVGGEWRTFGSQIPR